LYTHRGRTLELCGQYDDALAGYQELETLARERDDHALELAALIPQATVRSTHTVKFDPDKGRALSERALALARELNDHRAEAKVFWNLMLLEGYAERDPQQAVAYGEQALAIAREHNLPEELAYTLNDIVRVYWAVGQREQARAAQEEARELWRELGNLPMLADNLLSTAEGHYMAGKFDQAMALAQEALRVSQASGNLWGQAQSLGMMGPIYLEWGKVEKAIKALEESLPLAEQANIAVPLNAHILLAWFYGSLGDIEYGFELARLALAKADERSGARPFAQAVLGKLHAYNGNTAEAEAAIKEAYEEFDTEESASKLVYNWFFYMIESEVALANQAYDRALTLINSTIASTRAIGIRPFLTFMLYLKGQALLGLGHTDEARDVLIEARAEAEALDSSKLPRLEVLLTLSEIEAQAGNTTAAQALRKEAGEIVEFVANQIDSPKLRASFLALPHVRAVLEDT
jgi:tetratricopeptide (TPR) repeat protein